MCPSSPPEGDASPDVETPDLSSDDQGHLSKKCNAKRTSDDDFILEEEEEEEDDQLNHRSSSPSCSPNPHSSLSHANDLVPSRGSSPSRSIHNSFQNAASGARSPPQDQRISHDHSSSSREPEDSSSSYQQEEDANEEDEDNVVEEHEEHDKHVDEFQHTKGSLSQSKNDVLQGLANGNHNESESDDDVV